jgi:SAM-dependent methyltransferase
VSERYHRAELKTALDPNHPSHILPPAVPLSHRVLDVGCGAGQTLIAAYPDRVSFGLDIDPEALRLGHSLTDRVRFVCGRAEALPYADEQFDLVAARVSLAYTNIAPALREIHRTLKEGGKLWMTLHPFSIPWELAKKANYKGRIFFGYVVLNSLLFHLVQKQFPFLGRYESFQTESGVRRALLRNGFDQIVITRGKHFLVTARRIGM